MSSFRSNTIVINIDHKWRDLAANVYAKLLLERLGYRVILIRNNRFDQHYCDVFNPCAIVMVHLYQRDYAALARRLRDRGILIILMPNEGIPPLPKLTDLVAGKTSDLSAVDLHFAWGDALRCALAENLPEQNICVSGSPRFDFYFPHLERALPDCRQLRERYGLDPGKRTITWATNFTHAQFYRRNQQFLRDDWKKLGVDQFLDPDLVARREYESREIHFDSIVRLVEARNDVDLILKLHPSEDQTFYYRRLAGATAKARGAIRIVHQDYIWNVLRVSEVHFGRCCTTSAEAWILGRPTLELCLHPQEFFRREDHAAGGDTVTEVDGLIERVDYYLSGGAISEETRRNRGVFLEQWCGPLDGRSTWRFARRIDRLIQERYDGTDRAFPLSPRAIKSRLLVTALEATNFRIHNWKVYGPRRRLDKLGRWGKYFDHNDERAWARRLAPCVAVDPDVSP